MSGGEHRQVYNDELVSQLYGEFQHRGDNQFAWSRVISQFAALPVLRGFWPMSGIRYTAAARVRDYSENSNDLDEQGTPQYGYDAANSLIPLADFNGTNEYLRKLDGGANNWADILGTENYVLAQQRGLTLGGWYQFDRLVQTEYMIAKVVTPGQISYRILKDAANNPSFGISNAGSGAAITSSVTSTVAVDTTQWFFVVGRFVPSTTNDIFVSNSADNTLVHTSAATGDAAIWNGTAQFTIAAQGTPGFYMDGRVSMQFLCACALSDSAIAQLYQQSRAMFNRI